MQKLEKFYKNQSNEIPISLWRHWPVADMTADGFVQAIVHFQNKFHFDLIKLSPNANIINSGFGLKRQWGGNVSGSYDRISGFMHNKDPQVLINKIYNRKMLREYEQAVKEIISRYPDIPILYTIISPFYHLSHLYDENFANKVEILSEVIAHISILLQDHVDFMVKAGVHGIYYSVHHASHRYFSNADYINLWRKFEAPILSKAVSLPYNCLHYHCQEHILDILEEVPTIQFLSFTQYPDIKQVLSVADQYEKMFIGGVNNAIDLVHNTFDNIIKQTEVLIHIMRINRFILASDCVLPINTPLENIQTLIDTVKKIRYL